MRAPNEELDVERPIANSDFSGELGILKQVINAPDYQAAIGLLSVPRLDSKFPD